MIVHGASFTDAFLMLDRRGALKSIEASSGPKKRRTIEADEIASVSVITNENRKTVAGTAGGAVIGTILAGPLGLVVGALASGNRTKHLVGVTLVTGEGFVAEVNPTELTQLLGAASAAANAQRESEQRLVDAEEFARFAGGQDVLDEDVSDRPILKRIAYGPQMIPMPEPLAREVEGADAPDPLMQYELHLREKLKLLDFTAEEIREAKELRRSLGLSAGQKACVHARLFAACIKQFASDGEIDGKEVARLRSLRAVLQMLGWAPGD